MQDAFIRHSVYLNRYAGGLYREALPELKKMREEITAKLMRGDITEFSTARLNLMLSEIKLIIDTTITGAINPKLFDDLAVYESEFSLKVLDKSTPASVVIASGVNASALLPEIAQSTMMLQGMKKPQTIEQVIKTFSAAHYKDIDSEIKRGITEGLTNDQLVKKIRYLSNSRTRQQAEAVIRTVANHVATTARTETFKQYDNLFQGEKLIAVLDSHTTLQCAARDQGVWTFSGEPVNDIARNNAYKRPPLHYGCRDIMMAQLKEEYDIKIESTRASEFGPVSNKLTYNDWLKKQPASFIDDVLGKTRGKLFRSEKLSLDKFVDRQGQTLTLDELKAKEL